MGEEDPKLFKDLSVGIYQDETERVRWIGATIMWKQPVLGLSNKSERAPETPSRSPCSQVASVKAALGVGEG